MNYRLAELLTDTSVTGTGTKIIDLDIEQIISRLIILWFPELGGNYLDDQLPKDISKIELVDGSDVLHSLNGCENQALLLYDRRANASIYGMHINTVVDYVELGIDFGRWLYDKELAFDPRKFNNPQLKITYDVDVSNTATTTGHLQVYAHLFDEKVISPIGFLMAKEHYSWAPSGSGVYEYVELPRDYPLRRMLIRGYLKDYNPDYSLREVKLDEDNDKRVPLHIEMGKYERFLKSIYPPIIEHIQGYIHGAEGYVKYVTPTEYMCAAFGLGSGSTSPVRTVGVIKGGKVDLECAESTMFYGGVIGWVPNHCYDFTFGDVKDLDDLYDITKVGKLRLRLRCATYDADQRIGVVLQQMRGY